MPRNEVGDRVHNFFAQDSVSHVQQHSPVADVNWPISSDNMWSGSQRQLGVINSNTKNYNMQSPDSGRGPSSYPFNGQHGLNFTQSIPRSELAKSQQPNLNGYMYGNQFYQTRQDEANFPAVDTNSDQRNIASGGSSFFEPHQWLGPQQQHTRAPVVSEPCDSADLFSGQQISQQQANMLHSLQRQQSGINDMQQLQQQVIFMQELQRQQQLHQQSTLNQVSSSSKVHSPALVNGSANSGVLSQSWGNEFGNTNWLQRGSPVFQGTNSGEAQRLMSLIPQQVDQSLYGVPVSGSRPSLNQFSKGVTDKQAEQPMPTFNSPFPDNQYAPLADQVSGEDGTLVSRQRLQVENLFGDAPSQAPTNAIDVGNLDQADINQKVSALQDLRGRQDLAVSSETSQEEAVVRAPSSQDEVGLDPTEERILFGSDDNIWAAFGNGEGGNPFEAAELDGVPSLQGGTWSALMQSAVAETSSNDVGLQEQWTGLNLHSAEVPFGGRNLTYNSERHKTFSTEDNLPQASSLNPVSVHHSDSTNSYHNSQGHRFPFEPGKSLQSHSSQGLVQSSDEGNKWAKFGQPQISSAEGHQIAEKTSDPLNREIISKNVSSPLAPELGGAREQYNKSAGWGSLESAMPSGDLVGDSFKRSQDCNKKNVNQGEVVRRGVGWNSIPGCNSSVTMESSAGSPQANMEVFSLPNSSTIPSASTMRSGEEPSHLFQNNHQSSIWRSADPSAKSSQHHVPADSSLLHLPIDIGEKEGKLHEMENSDKQETSNDSHRSNFSTPSSAAAGGENVLPDTVDSRFLPSGKQKLYNQAGQRTRAHKFQYHPMGNLDKDADPSYGMKHSTHSQPMLQQNAHHDHSKVFAQAPNILEEMGKARLSDGPDDGKGFGQVHSGGIFPGDGSNMSTPLNRSVGLSPKTASQSNSSPNMLQLLQKAVDPSRERGSAAHSSNSEYKVSSEVPEIGTADGSAGHLQRSQSSASQGFGLQLGPPSQQMSVRNHFLSSQTPTRAVSSSHSSHAAIEMREKSLGQMPHPHQAQCLHAPSDLLQYSTSRVPVSATNDTTVHSITGNFSSAFESASGFTYSRNQIQYPHTVRASGQDSSQLSNAGSPHGSPSTNHVSAKEPVSVSQSFVVPGIPLQGASSNKFTNMQANFSQQHLLSGQYGKDPSPILQPHQLHIMESSFSAPDRQGDHKGGNFLSANSLDSVEGEEVQAKESTSEPVLMENIDLVQKMNNPQGREPFVKNIQEGSPANSASMQRDIEAFGRSLKPNNFSNQSYSLLNQMWTLKNVDTDPSNTAIREARVPDGSAIAQQVPTGDSRMLSFSGPEDSRRMMTHDVAFSQDESQACPPNSNTNSAQPEQTQIAPSWFNQYRSFRDGHMLQMYDAHRAAAMKTAEPPFTPNSTSGLHALNSMQQVIHATADRSLIGHLGPSSIASSSTTEHFSSLQTLPLSIGQQHSILKPKKRKRATSELIPWYKEISLGLCSNQTISLAEIEWDKAVNRIAGKVKGNDLADDGPPRIKARRRLILTNQLMQQLFSPPPAALLSTDAKLECWTVAYSISRLALGDACSIVSYSDGVTDLPLDGKEPLPDKRKVSKRNDRHHVAKAMDELMGRARKLESDFVSLDKRASILDVIMEGQDLEKFSVFYRFARYHGRGQFNGAESSSTDAAARSHRPSLQRYVTAVPMPKTLPDRVQCLSL